MATNNTSEVQYRNTKSMAAMKAEHNNAIVEYGEDNRIGGSHAWFRCGATFGYVTSAAKDAIKQAGSLKAACESGVIQYTEAQGTDGKWYPQLCSAASAFTASDTW